MINRVTTRNYLKITFLMSSSLTCNRVGSDETLSGHGEVGPRPLLLGRPSNIGPSDSESYLERPTGHRPPCQPQEVVKK